MPKIGVCDDSGNVALLFAIAAPVFLLCAALSVDLGTFYLQKRALQGATDLAAIAAAQNPTAGLLAAQQNLVNNEFPSSAVQSVAFGNYVADPTLSPAQRFTPATGGIAVQVASRTSAPYYFGTILNLMTGSPPTESVTLNAQATAVIDQEAAFAIASGLASLNGGVENAVLGGLLGSSVSLSLMDYQSLANANIDLFAFSNALATRASLTAVTYNDLANTEVSAAMALGALADAAGASPGVALSAVDQLTTLAGLAPNTTIALGQLLSFGEFGSLQVNSAEPITATADALDMVSGIAELANGVNQVQVALTLNAPPIASATLDLTIGERPVGSGFVAIGPTGATVHTAQTRLLLKLQIAQAGSSSLISLPLYVEVASGTATLSALSCATDPTQITATLSVTPGIVDAWIGAVTSADMTNFSTEPSPGPATLLNIPGFAVITGRANASIDNLAPTSVVYSSSDIADDVRKTTSTTDFTSSLLYNLFANLQLGGSVNGQTVPIPQVLSSPLAATLATAATPIDQTVSQILQALGISLGNAYTWVSGVKCGAPKLVL